MLGLYYKTCTMIILASIRYWYVEV